MAKQQTVWDKGSEAERQRASLQACILRQHNRVYATEAYRDILTPKMLQAKDQWVRDFQNWKPQIKSQNTNRLRIDLAHHLFKKYPIPRFLDSLWTTSSNQLSFKKDKTVARDNSWVDFFLPWYTALGRGDSLYRAGASVYLSRKETHLFTQAPLRLNPKQAVWWARACSFGANLGQANNIALSVVGDKPILPIGDFWISVVRFFVQQDVKSNEIQILKDYISAMLDQGPYSLKGRTRLSMLEASRQWHRVVQNKKEMSRHKWEPTGVPTWEYQTGNLEDKTLVTWMMREILTGNELIDEGHSQRHCVASYKNSCINRNTSIWTLRRKKGFQEWERTITAELNSNGDIVQAKGFANRPPKPEEKHVLSKWALDNNLEVKRY